MVTSTVHEWKYIDVVEGSEHPYKCSLCSKTYFQFTFKTGVVKDHLLKAHYSAIGVAFDHDDDDCYDYEGADSGSDIDACSDGQWEEPGDDEDYGVTDSEDGQEGEEEKKGDGEEGKKGEDGQEGEEEKKGDGEEGKKGKRKRKGTGDAEINAPPSVATAMSWPERKKEDVDDAVGRWFYAHLIPFNVARNPYFKKMIEAINKAGRYYEPPSPRRLKSLMTDEMKSAIIKEKKAIKNKRKRNRMW